MPHHPIAQAFLRECGVPLAAPSANISGKPSPTTWQNVLADMDGRISCILKGGQTRVGLESTVVDCTGRAPVVLRTGAVTLEQLRRIVPSTRLAGRKSNEQPKSPGMKYRHYSPQARVKIVSQPAEIKSTARAAYIGIRSFGRSNDFLLRRICKTPKEYAHALFAFFRQCDGAKISVIYCQSVEAKGIGLALMDRLQRASH
jgi:L-threonylcarbamoyladenylate synthase